VVATLISHFVYFEPNGLLREGASEERICEYKYLWRHPSLQTNDCGPTYYYLSNY
jgi:hypothetical protein